MSAALFWFVSLGVAFAIGVLASTLWDIWTLRIKVEDLMQTVPGSTWWKHRLCEGRALLALRGHRMTKRTRDALTVWLAEHEGQS